MAEELTLSTSLSVATLRHSPYPTLGPSTPSLSACKWGKSQARVSSLKVHCYLLTVFLTGWIISVVFIRLVFIYQTYIYEGRGKLVFLSLCYIKKTQNYLNQGMQIFGRVRFCLFLRLKCRKKCWGRNVLIFPHELHITSRLLHDLNDHL